MASRSRGLEWDLPWGFLLRLRDYSWVGALGLLQDSEWPGAEVEDRGADNEFSAGTSPSPIPAPESSHTDCSSGTCLFLLQKKFFGPQRRKMMFMGFVRLGVWYNFFRARKGGFSGNLEGEGFILGGVFVVGAGKQVNS